MADDEAGPFADHVSDWQPITGPADIARLGKLIEELNEAGKIVARCIIQGVDGSNPSTGESNRYALQKELADVQAMIELVIERYNLNPLTMHQRIERKKAHKRRWFDALRKATVEMVRVPSGCPALTVPRELTPAMLAVAHGAGFHGNIDGDPPAEEQFLRGLWEKLLAVAWK